MPIRPGRVGRVGVIGAPVAKTAVVAAAVSPGPSPVAKAAVVGAAVTRPITRRQGRRRGCRGHTRSPPAVLRLGDRARSTRGMDEGVIEATVVGLDSLTIDDASQSSRASVIAPG